MCLDVVIKSDGLDNPLGVIFQGLKVPSNHGKSAVVVSLLCCCCEVKKK